MKPIAPLAASIVSAALICSSIAAASASPSETRVSVHARLPVACEATIVASTVVTITPLLINATVHQSCNTRHDLSVTYVPQSVTNPTRLVITFDGALPNVKAPGVQTFTNLTHTVSDKPLVIRYSGGTTLQRQALAKSLGIAVTVR